MAETCHAPNLQCGYIGNVIREIDMAETCNVPKCSYIGNMIHKTYMVEAYNMLKYSNIGN